MDGMIALTALMLAAAPARTGAILDTARIEQLTAPRASSIHAAGVFKVSVPRYRPRAHGGGVKLTPPSGLTSWRVRSTGSKTMVMATWCCEDQVNPVMSTALDNGLEVTALSQPLPR